VFIRKQNIEISLCAFLFFLSFSGVFVFADKTHDSDSAIERLRHLQNVSVRLHSALTYLASKKYPSDIPHALNGTYGYDALFRFLDGRAYYDWRTDSNTLRRAVKEHTALTFRNVNVLTHERAETLTENSNAREGIGIIRTTRPPPEDTLVDIALGLRYLDENAWIKPDTLRQCEWTHDPDGNITATCFIAPQKEYPNYREIHRSRFDPRRGYALIHYSVADGDYVVFDVEYRDLRSVDGIYLPYTLTASHLSLEDGKMRVWARQDVTIERYLVNDPANTPDSFFMRWKSDAFVKDMRTGALIKQPTTGPITDAQIIAGRRRRQATLDALALPRDKTKPVLRWLGGVGSLALVICIMVYITGRRRVRAGVGG